MQNDDTQTKNHYKISRAHTKFNTLTIELWKTNDINIITMLEMISDYKGASIFDTPIIDIIKIAHPIVQYYRPKKNSVNLLTFKNSIVDYN